MPISIPSGRTLPLQAKAGGGFKSLGVGGAGGATLFFADDFNAQADWNGSQNGIIEQYAALGDVLPTGWDAARSTFGYSANETISIKSGAEFTQTGTGKAFVKYRGGRAAPAFWTDGILSKTLPIGTKKVFSRFWIKFQPGWTNRGQSKLFRIQGWLDGSSPWPGDNLMPGFIWDFAQSNFGSRLQIAQRAHAIVNGAQNFNFSEEPIINMRTDGSLHWSTSVYDLNADGAVDNSPQLINQLTGLVFPNSSANIEHEEIMGSAWHKVEIYVEMNTAPGAYDGKLVMWLDDTVVIRNLVMPWIQSSGDPNKDWRIVKLGGNDSFTLTEDGLATIDDANQIQEWFAIDAVEIYTGGLPEGMSWVTQ
jgi:hypothetical protein